MNSKIKLIIGIIGFSVVLVGSVFLYNLLSKEFSPSEGTAQSSTQEKQKAPNFTVLDNSGKEVNLSDFFGKPIVLNFWASWCPPCKAEMPEFNRVYSEVKDEVVFLMVNMTDGQRETVEKAKAFIKETNYSFPVFFDTEGNAAYTYGISSIPTTLFIDKDGNIVKAYQGAINEKTLRSGIDMIGKRS